MGDWRQAGRERVAEKRDSANLELADGINRLRVFPHKKGPNFAPIIEFRVHWNVGPNKRMCACGKDIDGNGRCWLCDVQIPKLNQAGKTDVADDIGPRERVGLVAAKVDNGKCGDPKLFCPSNGSGIPGRTKKKALATRIHAQLVNGVVPIEDPVKGRCIVIEKVKDAPYEGPHVEESAFPIPKDKLAKLKPLEEYVPVYSEKDQKDTYFNKEDNNSGGGGGNRGGNDWKSRQGNRGQASRSAQYEEESAGTDEYTEEPAEEPADEYGEQAEEPTDGESYDGSAEDPDAPIDDVPEEYEQTDDPEPEPEPEYEEPAPPPPPRRAAPPPATKKAPPPAAKKTAPPATKKAAPPATKRR